ncbi:Fasciclin-2-like protein [Leptotrombidium deliense]|uniref:Fasciclin-2-like protein n=1 Tax=Leptotrombidium deliense TaxID=299467 RepID=A0A443S1V2_9ACAR|nr:Fasciclin-2-like protein [Leptotrombidium deliense]
MYGIFFDDCCTHQKIQKGQQNITVCRIRTHDKAAIAVTKDNQELDCVSYEFANGKIMLKGPLKEDSKGNYTIIVEIRNSNLKKNKSLIFEIVFPPEIRITANLTNVYEGESLVINCNVSGSPIPAIKWKKNDKYLNFTDSHLQIEKLKKSDDGEYHCFADNGEGLANESLFISVKIKAEIISFEHVSAIEGREASLICIVRGSPLPNVTIEAKYRQFSNSTQVQKTSNISQISVRKTLEIKNITFEDSREYICKVTQNEEIPLEINETTHLNVFAKPFIFINETKIKTVETTINLFCFVPSNYNLSVLWLQNNEFVIDEKMTGNVHNDSVTTSILSVNPSVNMFGNYSCQIMFCGETFRAKIDLIKLLPPSRPLNVTYATTHSSAILVIFVDPSGESEIDFVVYHISVNNGTLESSPNVYELIITEFEAITENPLIINITISDLDPDTNYVFELSLKNEAGESESITVNARTEEVNLKNINS